MAFLDALESPEPFVTDGLITENKYTVWDSSSTADKELPEKLQRYALTKENLIHLIWASISIN